MRPRIWDVALSRHDRGIEAIHNVHKGVPGIVIGNGPSRKDFPLSKLQEIDIVTFGCNALYRDFIPDHLVAIDGKMIREIVESDADFSKTKRYCTRKSKYDFTFIHFQILQDYSKSSGMYALALALTAGCNPIYLLGIDLVPKANLYAGTHNYKNRGPGAHAIAQWRKAAKAMRIAASDRTWYVIQGQRQVYPIENTDLIDVEEFESHFVCGHK